MADPQTYDPTYTLSPDQIPAANPGGMPQPVSMPTGGQQPPQPSQGDVQSIVSQAQGPPGSAQAYGKVMAQNKLQMPPAPPKMQDYPKPPQDDFKNVFKEASPGLVFATVLGTLAMRANGMGAMAAATGYMNGFHEGDKEKIERDRQKWQDSMEAVQRENDLQHKRYSDILAYKDRQNTVTLLNHLSTEAAALGDPVMAAAAASGDIQKPYELLASREKAGQNIALSMSKFGMTGNPINNAYRSWINETIERTGAEPTADQKVTWLNNNRPARSDTAMATQQFITQYKAEHNGRQPTAKEIVDFGAHAAAYKAAERTLAIRGAQLGVAGQELVSFAGPALAASELVPRGQWVPINKLNQDAKRLGSDANLRELSNRNAGLINAYSQVISRAGVPTVTAQNRAAELLNTAESKEAYERAVDTLVNEADLAEKAPDQVRERLESRFFGRESEGGKPAVGGHPPRVHDQKSYDAVPSGSDYIDPQGNTRTKP